MNLCYARTHKYGVNIMRLENEKCKFGAVRVPQAGFIRICGRNNV